MSRINIIILYIKLLMVLKKKIKIKFIDKMDMPIKGIFYFISNDLANIPI